MHHECSQNFQVHEFGGICSSRAAKKNLAPTLGGDDNGASCPTNYVELPRQIQFIPFSILS